MTDVRPSVSRLIAGAATMFIIVAIAAAFRFSDLSDRVMHGDEAVQAVKFGRLLELGQYRYDPQEYHGPSLHYLTLPIARWLGRQSSAELQESDLRAVPALFGTLLVALIWLLRHDLGWAATLAASLFSAVSSSLVFYSRYYIHEISLVFFSFAALIALWRLLGRDAKRPASKSTRPARGTIAWLVILGASVGMMHATKETWVIALLALVLSALTTVRLVRRVSGTQRLVGLLAIVVVAAMVSSLFYSSWWQHPHGVIDSFATYVQYLRRAMGDDGAATHVQSWDYYLRVLFWWRRDGDHVWTEATIAGLAIVGACFALARLPTAGRRAALGRFLTIYVVVLAIVYSSLPYKTPWCALGFMHGLVLLAGIGFGDLWDAARTHAQKCLVAAILIVSVTHLGWQSWQASIVRYDDPRNPYNYAPASRDVVVLADRLEEIVAAQDPAEVTLVDVVCEDDDYWPLPWYLRRLPLVAWYEDFPASASPAMVVTQPALRDRLARRLFIDPPPGQRRLFVELEPESDEKYWFLRPNEPLVVFVRLDVWEAYQRNGENPG